MKPLINKNSPFYIKIAGWLFVLSLTIPAVFVFPLLLFGNFFINLKVLNLILNQDGYTRQSYHITEYVYYVDHSPPDIRIERFFKGTVDHKRVYMDKFTFVDYSPELRRIVDSAPEGRTPLNLTIDIWYNPTTGSVLPYSPGFFNDLRERLISYPILVLLFLANWYVIYLIPKIYAHFTNTADAKQREMARAKKPRGPMLKAARRRNPSK